MKADRSVKKCANLSQEKARTKFWLCQVAVSTYIVDCFSFDFADIVRSWLCFLYHLHCDWSKNSVFTSLTWEVSAHVLGFTTKATILTTSIAVASAVWLEESIVVVWWELKACIAMLALSRVTRTTAVIRPSLLLLARFWVMIAVCAFHLPFADFFILL